MIYFIRSECPNGFIKIGRTRDLAVRLNKLQCGTPYQLTVIRVLAGGIVGESFLRRHFQDAHVRGEWYRPTEKLLAYIESAAVACLGPNPPAEAVPEEVVVHRANLAEGRAQIARAQAGIAPRRQAGTRVPVRRLKDPAPAGARSLRFSRLYGMVGAAWIEHATPTMSTSLARWKRWNIKGVSGMQPVVFGTMFSVWARSTGTKNQRALRYRFPISRPHWQ